MPFDTKHDEWWWCLEKPTTPNDRRSAHLPGRTQASSSYLPGRGGRGCRGAGRWWGRGGLHGRERLCRDGRLRIRLVAGDGREDHVADDPPGPASAVLAIGPSRHGSVPGIRMSSPCRSFRLGREVTFVSDLGRVRLASLPARPSRFGTVHAVQDRSQARRRITVAAAPATVATATTHHIHRLERDSGSLPIATGPLLDTAPWPPAATWLMTRFRTRALP